jgi:hypothetical protein
VIIPNSPTKTLVIQKYLNGKTRDLISKEIGISTGGVSNIIREWKRGIRLPEIDALRDFAKGVEKSEISIAQCAQGYRIIQLMKDLGISDDSELDGYTDNNNNDNSSIRSDSDINTIYKKMDFPTFVKEIYSNCKNLGIPPTIIPSWIKDMFDFYLSYSDGKTDSLPDINIPFISQISFHIEQKKKEYADLKLYKKRLKEDIQKLEAQKNRSSHSLSQIKQEEKEVLSYMPFFHDLEKKLKEYHDINLKDDILGFSQVIDDFKQHGFNAHEIINEYLKPRSLKLDISTKEAHIRVLSEQKASLHNSILSLESQVSSVTQTMNIYYELEGMKFGLKELKQLWYKIREIADANKILHKEVVSKFLKDIEEQYDDKLGFESKIIEKKEELAQLKNKINNNRLMYRLEPSIGLTLSNLFQVGITERDIIGISQVVELCTNNTDSSSVSSPNYQNENKNNTMEGGKNRLERWKSLIDDLKSYGEIKSVLKEQHVKKEMIKKEIDDLDSKKQEISVQCQNGISFLNEINNKMFYFKGLIDHYNNDMNNGIKTSSRIIVSSPFFIIYNNTRKEKDDGNETK